MYGLPQAGIIAQEMLEKQLAEYGYNQSKTINKFWKHKTRPICFTLIVDNFAVKYVNEEDTEHLINTIKKYYPMTVDRDATKFIGLTIKWDYINQKAHIHMPGYLKKALIRFKYKTPDKNSKLTTPPHDPTIWSKNTIRKGRLGIPPTLKRRN
jgi:hypothetical protein